MRFKLPDSSKNWLSIFGVTLSLISLFLILFLWVVSISMKSGGSYLGLITFIIMPSILIIGLLLIPIGMIRSNYKSKKESQGWPKIDLNQTKHRNAFFIFISGTLVFIFISAIGSYEAFHITESVEFCGKLCHEVMIPEYTAYTNSPHARVSCVECHVGEGADWYVRSKLSGLYQIYSVLFNKYPRPIPTPIHNLRPAREICERCHWPQKFYSRKLDSRAYFLSDEDNTRWNIQLVLKTAGEHSAHGLSEGIHWHINPDIKIEYYASDEKKQIISWVRTINLSTRDTLLYTTDDNEFDANTSNLELVNTMDCMDCHSRPSHDYREPATFVNHAFLSGDLPRDLPEFKLLSMDLCDAEYPSTDSAMNKIKTGILEFYAENYPEQPAPKLDKAISELQNAFQKNLFPEMKVRWDTHYNNIGHLYHNGCFRCHDGLHQTETGESISMECINCHSINMQGTVENPEYAMNGESLEFKHPVDIDKEWKEILCSECHTGLSP